MKTLKYILIWLLLLLPFLMVSGLTWFLLRDVFIELGIRLRYAVLVGVVLPTIVFLMFYLFSERLLLRWYGAQEVKEGELYDIGQEVGVTVYRFDSEMPNAFHAGGVAVSSALEKLLSEEELRAVLAHEADELGGKESRVYIVAAAISGVLVGLSTAAYWASLLTGFGQEDDPAPNLIKLFVMSVVAPFAAFLTHLVVPTPSGKPIADTDARLRREHRAVGPAAQAVPPHARVAGDAARLVGQREHGGQDERADHARPRA
ncbi:MAG: M48 family metalloprotease, partial [Archaeoglobaceae archaeon]